MPSDLSPAKDVLRERFRAYRRALAEVEHRRLSRAVLGRAGRLDVLHGAETVHVYWPLLERREIDTRPLVRRLMREGRRVVLPRVTATGAEPLMEHVLFTGEQALHANDWGLREPAGRETVAPAALDLVVVPALGAGRNGHRIGHGLGYYDAFLRDLDVPRLCLTYAATLVEHVPAEPHDVPMTHLVTEYESTAVDSRCPGAGM